MMDPMRRAALSLLLTFAGLAFSAPARSADARLNRSFRKPAQAGWIFVHLEGKPSEIGYQHGFLLAPEILDAQKAIKLALTHESKDWNYFRNVAEKVLWPHVEQEYRDELTGMVAGLTARNVKLDIWDMVATNAWLELDPYYVKWAEKNSPHGVGEHC